MGGHAYQAQDNSWVPLPLLFFFPAGRSLLVVSLLSRRSSGSERQVILLRLRVGCHLRLLAEVLRGRGYSPHGLPMQPGVTLPLGGCAVSVPSALFYFILGPLLGGLCLGGGGQGELSCAWCWRTVSMSYSKHVFRSG